MIEIRTVESAQDRELFLSLPWRIYQGDPLWVPPLLPQIRSRLDPARGAFFERGEAKLFLAYRGSEIVCRVCAAEDRITNSQHGRADCLFGFFETIDDHVVAEGLLDQAATWGRSKGLVNLIGPYHLDYEDGYGILVGGRDRPPAILCGHTPRYYQLLVEGAGFVKARADALAFHLPIDTESIAFRRLQRFVSYLGRRARFRIRGADLENRQAEVDRVFGLINRALSHLPNFAPWQRSAPESIADDFRKTADPDLILFAEVDDQVVGWFLGIPSVNEALIHANGLRYPWDSLRTWWHMRQRPQSLAIKSALVLHEHWDDGVPVMPFAEMYERAAAEGYRWSDLSLTPADNPTTRLVAPRMGAKIYKRYRVYEKGL
jgi:hypothetical protein